MIYYLILLFLLALLWSWLNEKIHDHYTRKRVEELKKVLNNKHGYIDTDGERK